jgi:hypothetical protein
MNPLLCNVGIHLRPPMRPSQAQVRPHSLPHVQQCVLLYVTVKGCGTVLPMCEIWLGPLNRGNRTVEFREMIVARIRGSVLIVG